MFDELSAALRARRPASLITVVEGLATGSKLLVRFDADREPISIGSLGNADLDRVVMRDALGELASGRSGVRHYGPQGQAGEDAVSVFIESFAPPPNMLIFGAVDFTKALVRVAKILGYRVTVCDAREVFATTQRFPHADEVVVDWPHRLVQRVGPDLGPADAICVLTHDHKFDVPAIIEAFGTDVGYIGAMGSRRTAAERERLLVGDGATAEQLQRLMAPIGLDIGARTPEETAIAICAEIVAKRTGREPSSLRTTTGPIHVVSPSGQRFT